MNERIIRALPRDVADKIAAGEVVERPLSIVKELVENSIDAGATSITVEIQKGGKEYIRVTDNGCGIPKDQLELAFMRYATSKLHTEEDLDDIETLGFRGEALASIAAVSRTELITKTAGARTGARISLAASEIFSIEDAACEEGTTIIVKDLFFNVPARLKFLKPDNTESSLVTDYVSKMAIAYPAVRMRLVSNGSILFSTPGRNSLKQAILTVYSAKTMQGLVEVAYEEGAFRIRGYTSSPTVFEKTRRKQVFFVNGRLVKSRLLEQALADAYHDKLFDGQYPSAFLFLELDPRTLDVNIHPHKTEIRFYQEKEVHEFVMRSVRKALLNPQAMEVRTIQGETSNPAALSEDNNIADLPERSGWSAEILDKNEDNEGAADLNKASVVLPSSGPKVEYVGEANASPYKDIFARMRQEERVQETAVQEEVFTYTAPQGFKFSGLSYIGQAFSTYLVFKDADGLYIMDQHAVHERVMFEKLLGRFNSEPDAAQQLLAPIVVELGYADMQAAPAAAEMLSQMGFELKEFGPASYAVTAVPGCMQLTEAEDFLTEFFEAASETRMALQAKRDAITMRSCKSAVKAHDRLSPEEVKQLLSDLDKCENPYSCPHGRPTFLKFTESELEKMFKRK